MFSDAQAKDGDLHCLAALTGLTRLQLDNAAEAQPPYLTNEALEHILPGMTRLRRLEAAFEPAAAPLLCSMSRLSALQELHIWSINPAEVSVRGNLLQT